MKISFRKRTSVREVARMKNKARVRKKVNGSVERPRLSVFRSSKHMYAQIVDDTKGVTLASASTLKMDLKSKSSCDSAKAVGLEIAKMALAKKIKDVVFDRSGYVYHGRVKAVAEGAREGGLNF